TPCSERNRPASSRSEHPRNAFVQPPDPRLLGRYRRRWRGLPRPVRGFPRTRAQRMDAQPRLRAAGPDRRARPGVRGARHAARFPPPCTPGRRARGHRGAGARAPGQPGVRAGGPVRRRRAGVGAGAGGGAGYAQLPAARAARRAVRTTQTPRIERGARLMSATAILMQVSSVEPLPEDAPADAVALAADAASQAGAAPVTGGELDLLHLVLHASL